MIRFFKNERASLTLEAAMVMPFFLLFIVFLAAMKRIGIAEIALDHAASETTEMIAEHVYPAALLNRKISPTIDTFIKDKTNNQFNLAETKNLLSKGLNEVGVSPGNLLNSLSSKILTPVVQNKFAQSTGQSFFNKHHVKIDKIEGIKKGEIEMVVEYKMDLFLPFIHKSILLKQRAYEKFWSV